MEILFGRSVGEWRPEVLAGVLALVVDERVAQQLRVPYLIPPRQLPEAYSGDFGYLCTDLVEPVPAAAVVLEPAPQLLNEIVLKDRPREDNSSLSTMPATGQPSICRRPALISRCRLQAGSATTRAGWDLCFDRACRFVQLASSGRASCWATRGWNARRQRNGTTVVRQRGVAVWPLLEPGVKL